jgi:hypothetical protein
MTYGDHLSSPHLSPNFSRYQHEDNETLFTFRFKDFGAMINNSPHMSSAGQVSSRHKPICVLLTEPYHSRLPLYVRANFSWATLKMVGTAVAQWLRCCATNRKVAGSIPASISGFFIDIKSFRSHYGPGVDSASNRNKQQEYFLGVKVAGA